MGANLVPVPKFPHPTDEPCPRRDNNRRVGSSGVPAISGDALLVDGHIRSEFEARTIPEASSVRYTHAADRLGEFGCGINFDGCNCEAELPDVALFCNDPWCGQFQRLRAA